MQRTVHHGLRFCVLLLAIAWGCTDEVAAQTTPTAMKPDTSGKEEVFIDNATELRLLKGRNGRSIQRLVGEVELSQDSIYMYCDSADLINSVQLYAYDNVVIQQGDSIAAFSNYLDYNAETQLADLRGNVILQNGTRELYTDALRYDLATKLATYTTGGRLTDGSTQLFSTRGYYYAERDQIYFRDSVVVIGDNFELRADTLMYDATLETVFFLGPTVIRTDTAEIYCEDGFYRVTTDEAVFRQNAQYRSGRQIAAADSIVYAGRTQEYILEGQAYVREGDRRLAKANKIVYRKAQDVYELEGNGLLIDSARTVRGEFVRYDRPNNTYKVTGGRPKVVDGNMILEASDLDFDNATGRGIARGNVIWQDTSAQLEIRAEQAVYNQETGYLKASGGRGGRPLLITILSGDSLYLTADTLFSEELTTSPEPDTFLRAGEPTDSLSGSSDTASVDTTETPSSTLTPLLPDTIALLPADTLSLVTPDTSPIANAPSAADDPIRVISAYRDVRVYKSDMQALCDSLSFNTTDSILTLYRDPILWQDTSQLLADTIDVYLKNNALDKVHLKKKALVVTSPDLIFFNQVKGKNIFAFFDSTELRRTDVVGNAEAVYYAQDAEGAYIGVNKTACSRMSLDFKNGGIVFIRFLTAPSGRLDPLSGLNPLNQPKLEGFVWAADLRPANFAALFGPPLRPSKGGTPLPPSPPAEIEIDASLPLAPDTDAREIKE